MSLSYKLVNSPIGKLKLVAGESGLVAMLWEKDNPSRVRLQDLVEDSSHPMRLRTEPELKEYFAGERSFYLVPIAIIVPCPRVIGAYGDLNGFAKGLEAKAHLLNLEWCEDSLFKSGVNN